MDKRIYISIGILLLCFLVGSLFIYHKDRQKDSDPDEIHVQNNNENRINEYNLGIKGLFFQEAQNQLKRNLYTEDIKKITNKVQSEKEALLEDVSKKDRIVIDIIYKGKVQEKRQDIKNNISTYPAGTLLDTKELDQQTLASLFYQQEINEEIKNRVNGKSYGAGCKIPYSELSYIRVLHTGFDQNTYIGEIIVNKAIADDVIEIMKELYEKQYPIERMVLVDEYNADDNASMEDNNSSAFNYRVIDGTSRLSLHSYGLAIDINPLYNPYIRTKNGETMVLPVSSVDYVDRAIDNPYFIRKGDACYEAFKKRGFSWGGDWVNRKDYQHFEKPFVE